MIGRNEATIQKGRRNSSVCQQPVDRRVWKSGWRGHRSYLDLVKKEYRASAIKPVDARYGIDRQYRPAQARANFFKRMTARYKK